MVVTSLPPDEDDERGHRHEEKYLDPRRGEPVGALAPVEDDLPRADDHHEDEPSKRA
jgi:hypothetical protein